MLAGNVVEKDGRAGIPNYLDALAKTTSPEAHNMVLGFCGKTLEAAQFLLREAELDASRADSVCAGWAKTIIASFLRLKIAPPEGEGFHLDSGPPDRAHWAGRRSICARSATTSRRCCRRISARSNCGREHPEWLAWCRTFGDWLLTQQQPDGGFPRIVEARHRRGASPLRPTPATTPCRCWCC